MKLSGAVQIGRACLLAATVAGGLVAQVIRIPTPVVLDSTARKDGLAKRRSNDATVQGTKKKYHLPCEIIPIRNSCMIEAGVPDRIKFINDFYRTYSAISFLGQVKSIYNGAASAATVSADLTSLNFTSGMQVNVSTNVQAGSTGEQNVTAGTIPTLTTAAAGQAAQNLLYGGTLVSSIVYPLLSIGGAKVNDPGAFGMTVDLAGREGVDIQNFKPGTSTTVSSPPSHSSGQIEGYLWYNSTNLTQDATSPADPTAAAASSTFAGALFLGGSYGYNYMSHDYARDYGFGDRIQNGVGQISVGLLINQVAKISVSRGFGPSQTYYDSAAMGQKTVNNFKSWSIGITYQSPPPSK
jgi:hypothetical protein